VFSHDKLYMAVSRAAAKQYVKVIAYPADYYTRIKGAKVKAMYQKGEKRTCQGEDIEKSNRGTYTKNMSTKKVLT
jgi:hypothetical protein